MKIKKFDIKLNLYIFIGLLLVISLNILINYDQWCGDPEINIIFAKNILKGHFLQFNIGEYSSGNTSVLYSSIIAISLYFLPLFYTAYLMKCVGFIAATTIFYHIYKHSIYLGIARFNALILSCFLLSPTFFWFHALGGMENIIFAAIVIITIRYALEGYFLTNKTSIYLLIIIWPVVFFLRPELIFLLLSLLLISIFNKNKNLFFSSLLSLILIIIIVLYIENLTSVPLHGAGNARLEISKLNAKTLDFKFFNIYLNYKSLFIIYSFLPSVFIMAFTKFNALDKINIIIISSLIVLPLILYSTSFLPSTHISRYSLYVFSTYCIIFINLISKIKINKYFENKYFLLMLFILPFMFSLSENFMRIKFLPRDNLATYKDRYNANFDYVSRNACEVFDCTNNRPVSLGISEVQLRLRLDERFIIRSLDGIVDHKLNDFIKPTGIDHLGYIKSRKIDYILATPNYNKKNSPLFDLKQLNKLKLGETKTIEGVKFTREKNILYDPTFKVSFEKE